MVKLIVTDLDGCLFDGKGNLPSGFDEVFHLMEEKGVLFAAASGRSIAGIKNPFGEYSSKMAFISDNGAGVYYKDEQLFSKTINRKDYLPIIEEAGKHKNLLPVVCGVQNAWIHDTDRLTEREITELKKYYPSWKEGKYGEIPEDVLKIALLYFDDIEKNIYPIFERFNSDNIICKVTAFVWIDIYDAGVSKGTGVKAIQEMFGIDKEETIVFGDYLNDLSMADHAARSYAPSNAHIEVRRRYTETIGSNEDGAVLETIRRVLEGKEG